MLTELCSHRVLLIFCAVSACIAFFTLRVPPHPVQTSYPRVRKMDNPFMVSARYLLDFFEAKYLAWSSSIFDELHRKVSLV